jgi:hypothetical protein
MPADLPASAFLTVFHHLLTPAAVPACIVRGAMIRTPTPNHPGRRMWRAGMVLLTCTLSASCAFVVHGRSQAITVTSDPSGARVYIDNEQAGLTPARLSLPRSRTDLVLRIEKDAYQPAEVRLKRFPSAWIAGDAAMAVRNGAYAGQGLDSPSDVPKAVATIAAVTLGIDFATGAAYRLSPSRVQVKLTPRQSQGQ